MMQTTHTSAARTCAGRRPAGGPAAAHPATPLEGPGHGGRPPRGGTAFRAGAPGAASRGGASGAPGQGPGAIRAAAERSAALVRRVAEAYDLAPSTLLGADRHPEIVEARRVAMCLLYESGLSVTAIGRVMRRNHATVHHHLARVQARPTPEERYMLADLRPLLAGAGAQGRQAPTPPHDGKRSGQAGD